MRPGLFDLSAATTMPDVVIASRSEVGARSRNEDYLQHGAFDAGWYAVLSDGAGGHSNGAVAADLVVRMVAHELGSQLTLQGREQPALHEVVHTANDALNRQQQGLRGQKRMHATLVMLWIGKADRQAVWSHVGDSRLYHSCSARSAVGCHCGYWRDPHSRRAGDGPQYAA